MAGHSFLLNGSACFIDYADDHGEAVVGDRTYRWEFHNYCGPLFLRKDGEPMKNQPGEHHPVWPHFDEWLKERKKK